MDRSIPASIELRRTLHRTAEPSDHEEATAALIRAFVAEHGPDELVTGIGGHGVAALFRGREPGPTVLVRSDLDAVPVPETLALDYGSQRPGVAHKCGHDGHMAIVAGLAPLFRAHPPERGAVVLLFQPAE